MKIIGRCGGNNQLLHRKRSVRVTWTDLLIGAWLLCHINDIVTGPSGAIIMLCTGVYLWAGACVSPGLFCRILLIGGCLQALLALLQAGGMLPSNHAYFHVTGTFDNPGPLGGFLAVCLMATVSQYRYLPRWLWGLCMLFETGGIILSDSRAAWLSVLIGTGYFCMIRLQIRPLRQLACLAGVCCLFGLWAYFCYKPASAQGRLVIWKVCAGMIKEHPVCGQGLASFPNNYMTHQTQYIQHRATDEEVSLMDNNRYAFNTFIHITCEQGIVGLALVLTVLCLLWWHTPHNCFSLKACLLAYLVFACFSYPTEVFLLQILLAMLCGCLSRQSIVAFRLPPRSFKILLIGLSCLTLVLLAQRGWQQIQARQALRSFFYHNDLQALTKTETYRQSPACDEAWLDSYAHILYLKEEYERAIPALQQSIDRFPTTGKYIDLGNCHQSLGQYIQAEQAYRQASQMLPCLIYPHYCLFLLYQETGQEERAYHKAIQIRQMSPKVNNDHTRELKKHINEYLHNREMLLLPATTQ